MKLRVLWSMAGLFSLLFGGFSQSVVMSQMDINQIGLAVVQITAYSGDEAISMGSGTIVASTGVIFTNWHVVQGGDDFEIAILENINELPVPTYFATLVESYEEIDFAILQIDRNIRGRELDPKTLELPFVPISEEEVQRGDTVTAFGYPDIGNGYLVTTSGEITTIQNGRIDGVSAPVNYQTNAELAPGNSGGAAVNENGELIGIPFFVSAEDRTGGRLGELIPITLALAARSDSDIVTNRNNTTTTSATPEQPVDGGVDVDCGNGVLIEDGIETTIVQMRSGYTYTVTVVGLNGFVPILAVISETGDGSCIQTPTAPASFSFSLPTTGEVTDMTNSIQYNFSQNTGQELANMSLVVGGAGGTFGEYVLILEGLAFTEFDNQGDPIVLSITPRMKASSVPLSVYMVGIVDVLDSLFYITNNNGEEVILVCDDAGNLDICPLSESLVGSYFTSANLRQIPADALDAMLSIPLSQLSTDSTTVDTLPFFMASNQYATYGHYIFAIHASSR
ncbi:MAG: serine protease [bacterium]|nr:serine protease [bacterium]